MKQSYSRIIGTGGYLPEKVLTNADLEKMVDTTDAWITERTGIRERHIAAPHETTCDLAERAARAALDAADVGDRNEPRAAGHGGPVRGFGDRNEPRAAGHGGPVRGFGARKIDLIIVATTTPDRIFPSTACLLQERLGMHGCAAFDIQAVCTGFIYALGVADQFIRTGAAQRALVVGAETMSRITDWSDRATCVLFGDGAGAVVLERSDEPGILSTHLHADGRYQDLLTVPGGVSEGCKHGAYIHMQGNEVFKTAVTTLDRIVDETLEANHINKSDVDWLIPHQANIRIISATAKKLKLPMERVVVTVAEHGNTSAASVPLALDVAVRDGRIQRGNMLLLEAFGGGFTWGSALLKY